MVFGGYDNTDKVGFLVPIERRNADIILYCLSLNNIFSQILKYIQIYGGPMAEYEHFQNVIIIYKLIIQYILWIPHSGVYKPRRKYVEECQDIT